MPCDASTRKDASFSMPVQLPGLAHRCAGTIPAPTGIFRQCKGGSEVRESRRFSLCNWSIRRISEVLFLLLIAAGCESNRSVESTMTITTREAAGSTSESTVEQYDKLRIEFRGACQQLSEWCATVPSEIALLPLLPGQQSNTSLLQTAAFELHRRSVVRLGSLATQVSEMKPLNSCRAYLDQMSAELKQLQTRVASGNPWIAEGWSHINRCSSWHTKMTRLVSSLPESVSPRLEYHQTYWTPPVVEAPPSLLTLLRAFHDSTEELLRFSRRLSLAESTVHWGSKSQTWVRSIEALSLAAESTTYWMSLRQDKEHRSIAERIRRLNQSLDRVESHMSVLFNESSPHENWAEQAQQLCSYCEKLLSAVRKKMEAARYLKRSHS